MKQTADQIRDKDPQAVSDVLEFYTDHQKRELEDLSLGESSIIFMYRFI